MRQLFRSTILSITASAIIFWLQPAAGLATFFLSITTFSLCSLIAKVEMNRKGEQASRYESELQRQINVLFSSQREAQIYNYAKKFGENLTYIDKDLRTIERRSQFYSGFVQGFIYIFMGSNILLNLFLSIPYLENGSLSIVSFAAIALLPLIIYSSIASLPTNIRR